MQKKIDRVIRQLEFDKVRGKLVRYTCSPWGAERALSLLPFKTYDEVERAQKETSEACAILRESSSPMSVVKEIRQILGRAEKGGFLQGEELRLIGDFLYALQKLKRSFQKDFFQKKAPLLSALALEIDLLPHLYQAIERAIDKDGSVLDKASPKLFSLRRKKINLQERIQERMERYLKDPSLKKVLQELLITIRNNRYVLPLKQEYRQALPGIVHDQSASGATLFVEPLPVVELHNELQQAKKEEEIEIERILRELSSAVAAETESLIRSVELYGYLDFTFSKGHYSLEIDAIEPRLNKDRTLKIVQGRHPLLGARAVPVDFHIGDSFQTLVITGPNTGGKTVTLKTVGLFVLMAQSGMHLPAAIGTEMPLYNGVYVDIGDEQNIEQSLSTFSGHLNNIIEILKYAGSKSLVLLDELGAGTDPQEGAALAMALLNEFHQRLSTTVATTHYSELKVFADRLEGMENASVEFDSQTLSPTYRLLIGIPGSSNAFAIAKKLGLNDKIINKAKSFLSQDELNMEKMMVSLAEKERRMAADSRAVHEIREELEQLKAEIAEEKVRLFEKRSKIIADACEEARLIVRRTKKTMNEIIKELHQLRQEAEQSALQKAEELRDKLHRFRDELVPAPDEDKYSKGSPLKFEDLAEGVSVFICSLKQQGEVIAVSSEEEIQIQVGSLRITTSLDDLQKLPFTSRHTGNQEKDQRNLYFVYRSQNATTSVDLRGLTVDEAVEKVDKYLDRAYLSGLKNVTIIHGRGTGKLREGIHQLLKGHRLVRSFRLGERGEGGDGVTVVSFD